VTDLLAADPKLFQTVSGWLAEHAGLSLGWERNLDLWRLHTSGGVPVSQVGMGIHQLLPVLTLAEWRRLGRETCDFIDVVQQPELHLHDALQPALGDLFLEVAESRRGVTVVETHAEGLLLRIRRRIAERRFPSDLVALYFIDDGPNGSELRRIRILENGEVDDWPEGVFLESYEEVKALRRAQRQRAG
jgi:predicted ATPase